MPRDVQIPLWLGVTTTWGTVLKGRSIRKVENLCLRRMRQKRPYRQDQPIRHWGWWCTSFIQHLGGRSRLISQFQASFIYQVYSKLAVAMKWDCVSKRKKDLLAAISLVQTSTPNILNCWLLPSVPLASVQRSLAISSCASELHACQDELSRQFF